MARSNPPRKSRHFGATVAFTSEDDNVAKHPAAEAPIDDRCGLLELKLPVRKKIYDFVAGHIKVVGLPCVGTKSVRYHALASTCKQVQQEFQDHIQKHALPGVRLYVVQIKDFDFRRLMTIIRRDQHFNREISAVVNVKVYHLITTEDIDVQCLIKWQKFAAQHASMEFVGEIPDHPRSRDTLLRRLVDAAEIMTESTEAQAIASTFKRWWCRGAREPLNTNRLENDPNRPQDHEFNLSEDEDRSEDDDDMMSLDEDSTVSESEEEEGQYVSSHAITTALLTDRDNTETPMLYYSMTSQRRQHYQHSLVL